MKGTILKGKDSSYRKTGTGNQVFRYAVTGTTEELAAYKEAQGENYREQDGTPIFFSTRFLGNSVELGISQNTGNVVAINSERAKLESIIKQAEAEGNTALSQMASARLLDILMSGSGANVGAPAKVESTSDSSEADLNL